MSVYGKYYEWKFWSDEKLIDMFRRHPECQFTILCAISYGKHSRISSLYNKKSARKLMLLHRSENSTKWVNYGIVLYYVIIQCLYSTVEMRTIIYTLPADTIALLYKNGHLPIIDSARLLKVVLCDVSDRIDYMANIHGI